MKVMVEVTGIIKIPDELTYSAEEKDLIWKIPYWYQVKDNIEFFYNEHLSEEEAIEDMASRLKEYPDEIVENEDNHN